jgi:hypothetical protein
MRRKLRFCSWRALAASGRKQTKEIDISYERFALAANDFGYLWIFLWKNGKNLISH